jgi:hypothetical protein
MCASMPASSSRTPGERRAPARVTIANVSNSAGRKETVLRPAGSTSTVVWGVASIIPEQCVELHRLLIDDIDLPAVRLVGDTTGPVRGPLLELSDDAVSRLAALVEHATAAELARRARSSGAGRR